MGYEEKLRKERFKKRATVVGAFSIIVLGGGLFYLAHHLSSNKLDISKLRDKQLVNFIMTANKDGKMTLINPSTKEKTKDLKLPKGSYRFTNSNDYKFMVGLNLDTKKIYRIDGVDGNLKYSELMSFSDSVGANLNDIKDMKVDGDLLAINFNSNQNLLIINLKTNMLNTVSLPKDYDAWTLRDNKIIYSYKKTINSMNVLNNSLKTINIGDKTTDFIVFGENGLLAFNKFGSGLNKSISLTLQPSSLNIDKLIKFENSNMYKINTCSNEDSFMAIYENAGNQSLERVSLKNDNTVLSDINLENKIIVDKHAVGINNYLYNKENNELEIISSDNGIKTYSIDIGDSDYMPISK